MFRGLGGRTQKNGCRSGHVQNWPQSYKSKNERVGESFAGEMSGHMFFADEYYGYDDALYSALRLLRLIKESGKKLSDLVSTIPCTMPALRYAWNSAMRKSSNWWNL